MGWKERFLILLVLLCLGGTLGFVLVEAFPPREDCHRCRPEGPRVFDSCFGACSYTPHPWDDRLCPDCGKTWYSGESLSISQVLESCLGPFR